MISKTIYILVASVLGVVVACQGTQDPDDTQSDSSAFMQRKLDYMRAVVDGLATEDFEKISKGAQDLMALSQEADWKVITSPKYLRMSNEFRTTASRLREQGHEKNLDGATLAYFEVTMSCVRCHKHLRNPQPDEPEN